MNELRNLWPWLGVSVKGIALAVLLGVGALGSALGLAAVSAWLIARASQMPDVMTLSIAAVGVRTFGISRGLLRYLERLASHSVALQGAERLRERIYLALADHPRFSAQNYRRGDLLNRVSQDVDEVSLVVVRSVLPALVTAVLTVGAAILTGVFLPSAGLVLLICLIIAAVVAPWLTVRAVRATEVASVGFLAEISAHTLTVLEGSAQLRVQGRNAGALARLQTADQGLTRVSDAAARPAAWAAGISSAAAGLAIIATLLLAIPAVSAAELAPVELAVVALLPLAAFEAASAMPGALVQLHRSAAAAARIWRLVAQGPEVSSTGLGEVVRTEVVQADAVRTVSPVELGWAGKAPVISNFELELYPGRLIALVGESGSGKTSALLTLAGLLPPLQGEVVHYRHDEASGSQLPGTKTGATVGFTAEDSHVFATTVLENLRVADGNLSSGDALELLSTVGLTPWLRQLPDGLDSLLGPNGTSISGGERRRLLLARALAGQHPLLALDEPLEHLDDAGASAVMHLLTQRTQAGKQGIIVATHRLSELHLADEILLLRQGRVAARGTHEELLVTDPAYLWAWQQEQS